MEPVGYKRIVAGDVIFAILIGSTGEEGVWKVKVDQKRNRAFYVNVGTGEKCWTLPTTEQQSPNHNIKLEITQPKQRERSTSHDTSYDLSDDSDLEEQRTRTSKKAKLKTPPKPVWIPVDDDEDVVQFELFTTDDETSMNTSSSTSVNKLMIPSSIKKPPLPSKTPILSSMLSDVITRESSGSTSPVVGGVHRSSPLAVPLSSSEDVESELSKQNFNSVPIPAIDDSVVNPYTVVQSNISTYGNPTSQEIRTSSSPYVICDHTNQSADVNNSNYGGHVLYNVNNNTPVVSSDGDHSYSTDQEIRTSSSPYITHSHTNLGDNLQNGRELRSSSHFDQSTSVVSFNNQQDNQNRNDSINMTSSYKPVEQVTTSIGNKHIRSVNPHLEVVPQNISSINGHHSIDKYNQPIQNSDPTHYLSGGVLGGSYNSNPYIPKFVTDAQQVLSNININSNDNIADKINSVGEVTEIATQAQGVVKEMQQIQPVRSSSCPAISFDDSRKSSGSTSSSTSDKVICELVSQIEELMKFQKDQSRVVDDLKAELAEVRSIKTSNKNTYRLAASAKMFEPSSPEHLSKLPIVSSPLAAPVSEYTSETEKENSPPRPPTQNQPVKRRLSASRLVAAGYPRTVPSAPSVKPRKKILKSTFKPFR